MDTMSLQIACLALAQLASPPTSGSSAPSTAPPAEQVAPESFAPQSSTPQMSAQQSSTPENPAPGPSTSSLEAPEPAAGQGESEPAAAPSEEIEAQPATFAEPAGIDQAGAEQSRGEPTSEAARLAQESVVSAGESELAGQGTSLLEVLQQNSDPSRRLQAVTAYWELVGAVGQHHFATKTEKVFAEMDPPQSAAEGSLWKAAKAAAAARRREAEVAVIESQHRLVQRTQLPAFSELPWPVDLPLVGAYGTKFETLFAGQPRPIRLQQIDQALPHLLERIRAEARAVAAGEEALEAAQSAYEQGQAVLPLLLEAERRFSQQHRRFWAAVLEYNRQIAEYAVTVAGPSTPPEILVSTLIETAPDDQLEPVPSGAAPGTIRQTSAEQPLSRSQPAFREVTEPPKLAPRRTAPPEPVPAASDGGESILKSIRVAR